MQEFFRDLLLRWEPFLPFLGGVAFGMVLGAERRLRFKSERDVACQERDQLAAGMVVALEGGQFRAVPVQTRRVSE